MSIPAIPPSAPVLWGTGVLVALSGALNAVGGLVGYSGNVGAATGTSLALGSAGTLSGAAANILDLINATSAQAVRVHNTWSSSGTNYERGVFDWKTTANVFRIGTEMGGTGVARNLQFIVGGVGKADYGVTTAGHWQLAASVDIGTVIYLNMIGGAVVVPGTGGNIAFSSNGAASYASALVANISCLSAGVIGVGTGVSGSAAGTLKAASLITGALTFATLPATPTAGHRAFISDCNVVAAGNFGAAAAGGGANGVPVYYDGIWRIG